MTEREVDAYVEALRQCRATGDDGFELFRRVYVAMVNRCERGGCAAPIAANSEVFCSVHAEEAIAEVLRQLDAEPPIEVVTLPMPPPDPTFARWLAKEIENVRLPSLPRAVARYRRSA